MRRGHVTCLVVLVKGTKLALYFNDDGHELSHPSVFCLALLSALHTGTPLHHGPTGDKFLMIDEYTNFKIMKRLTNRGDMNYIQI